MQILLQTACSALALHRAGPLHVPPCCKGLFLLLQGHFQIMFNPKVSPLFQRKLSWPMRIMYCSGVWSYLIGAISTPTFIIIPLVSMYQPRARHASQSTSCAVCWAYKLLRSYWTIVTTTRW